MNKYAVIGRKVQNSKSPAIFKVLFEHYKVDAEYGFVEADITDKKAMRKIVRELSGANITAPYKLLAAQACDTIETDTGKYKAVNTIIKKRDVLVGYNTDIYGVLKGLEALKTSCKNFLLLGTGGAAVAVAIAIKKIGGMLYVHNRTLHKAEAFAEYYGAKVIRNIQDWGSDCVTVVNTVACPEFVHEKIDLLEVKDLSFLDAVYPFPEYASHEKIKEYIKGEKWLIAQALRNFELFTGYLLPDKDKKHWQDFFEKYL